MLTIFMYSAMNRKRFSLLILAFCLISVSVFSQTENKTGKDTTLLGLPGDNLNLYAVLDLFQKSKTIEEFEKNLNLEKTGINNLDLNLDGKVDFIKVETKKKDDDFTFILQVDVTKSEKQDVAVILVSKDKNKKVTMQIVGDKDLYGKDFIVEPKETTTPAKTPNPGYTGDNPDTVYVPAKTTTVVVESTPIVQYVYSPAYVPYYPPYYYGYYPPYFATFAVVSMSIYWGSHAHYYGGYGYHGNTTVIHNTNNFNNYNNIRNTSNTVRNNAGQGNYNRGNNVSTRPSTGAGGSGRPSTGTGGGGGTRPSTQPSRGGNAGSAGGGARPSTQPSTGMGGGGGNPGVSTQPSNRSSGGFSGSQGGSRPSTQPSTRSSGGGSRFSGGGGSRGGGGRGGGGRR